MSTATVIIEEPFGILTDDDLYLDCLLVKPAETPDDQLRGIIVWVPRYPLNKTSTIVCARREVEARGAKGTAAHLVFDLRGTGYSDGDADDHRYDIDLQSIKAWAEERFGPAIRMSFLGLPQSKFGRVNLLPIRSGVVIETTHYPAATPRPDSPTVLYLSTFGQFDHIDDVRCGALAKAGYNVFGIDPLRYLLHASSEKLITAIDLEADLQTLIDLTGPNPILVGQPLGAGIALLFASLSEEVRGAVVIGQMQSAFRAGHIFAQDNKLAYDLTKQVKSIAPSPLVFVWPEGNPRAGTTKEMAALYQPAEQPKRIERTHDLTPEQLESFLRWIVSKKPN